MASYYGRNTAASSDDDSDYEDWSYSSEDEPGSAYSKPVRKSIKFPSVTLQTYATQCAESIGSKFEGLMIAFPPKKRGIAFFSGPGHTVDEASALFMAKVNHPSAEVFKKIVFQPKTSSIKMTSTGYEVPRFFLIHFLVHQEEFAEAAVRRGFNLSFPPEKVLNDESKFAAVFFVGQRSKVDAALKQWASICASFKSVSFEAPAVPSISDPRCWAKVRALVHKAQEQAISELQELDCYVIQKDARRWLAISPKQDVLEDADSRIANQTKMKRCTFGAPHLKPLQYKTINIVLRPRPDQDQSNKLSVFEARHNVCVWFDSKSESVDVIGVDVEDAVQEIKEWITTGYSKFVWIRCERDSPAAPLLRFITENKALETHPVIAEIKALGGKPEMTAYGKWRHAFSFPRTQKDDAEKARALLKKLECTYTDCVTVRHGEWIRSANIVQQKLGVVIDWTKPAPLAVGFKRAETKLPKGRVLQVWEGSMLEVRCEALVIPSFGPWKVGGLVEVVAKAAGPAFQDACPARKSVRIGTSLVLPSGALSRQGVQHVICAPGPRWLPDDEAQHSSLDALLASAVRSALSTASDQGLSSVALPLLSTGNMGYPVERACSLISQAIVLFFEENPSSSLVTVGVIENDPEKVYVMASRDIFPSSDSSSKPLGASVESKMPPAEPPSHSHDKAKKRIGYTTCTIHAFSREDAKAAADAFKVFEKATIITKPLGRNVHTDVVAQFAEREAVDVTVENYKIMLTGVPEAVERVVHSVNCFIADLHEIRYPDEWKVDPNQLDSLATATVPVLKSDPKWQEIVTKVHESLPKATVQQIQQIRNPLMFEQFKRSEQIIARKVADPNLKLLFHGPCGTDPAIIYKSDIGFEKSFSKQGLWGKGIYFSTKASYSHIFSSPYDSQSGQRMRQVFLARVIVGESWDAGTTPQREYHVAPERKRENEDLNDQYESVRCVHNFRGSGPTENFVLYQNQRAYPDYLITYSHPDDGREFLNP